MIYYSFTFKKKLFVNYAHQHNFSENFHKYKYCNHEHNLFLRLMAYLHFLSVRFMIL